MWITMSRIFIVPILIALLYPNTFWWNVSAAVVFMIASITDYYDGHFARKYNAISNFGKFMDPIADKILVTSILIMLIHMDRVDVFMVIIILARDTFISGIRSVAAADQIIIDAKPAGKWKTALQMVAIPAVMIDETWHGVNFVKIGYWALWVSVILSVTSGFQYYWGYLQSRRQRPSAGPARG
jgi:CDP-diacylglycerol--glycerol-3-phosphate 3-phosphatidyltransferase